MKFKDRPGDERTVHRKTRLLMVTVDYRPIHQMNIMERTGPRGKMAGAVIKNGLQNVCTLRRNTTGKHLERY
jgi:hypothetical protein